MRVLETVAVLGALGALGYYVYRRSRTTTAPVGATKPAGPLADAISGVAWVASDPLGWARGKLGIEPKEEEFLL